MTNDAELVIVLRMYDAIAASHSSGCCACDTMIWPAYVFPWIGPVRP